jgi:hypothetical protein
MKVEESLSDIQGAQRGERHPLPIFIWQNIPIINPGGQNGYE